MVGRFTCSGVFVGSGVAGSTSVTFGDGDVGGGVGAVGGIGVRGGVGIGIVFVDVGGVGGCRFWWNNRDTVGILIVAFVLANRLFMIFLP